MKIAGVIAEYNPITNGHIYHLEKTREMSRADFVVAVMSGDFTQRGMPAEMDKWTRSRLAAESGADLVVELPFVYATGSAEMFARGGIGILDGLGIVDTVSFGSESGDLDQLKRLADLLAREPDPYKGSLKKHLQTGMSFPAARQAAVSEEIGGDAACLLEEPNNILAISYLRELHRAGSSVVPHLVCREGSFHEEELSEGDFPSATAIRKAVSENHKNLTKGDFIRSLGDLLPYVPKEMLAEMLHLWNGNTIPMGEKDLLFHCLPVLRCSSSEQLSLIAHMGPQLAGHLKSAVRSMHFDPDKDITETFRKAAETRCFSYTRILRSLASLSVGQTKEDLVNLSDPKYLRLLGFSEKGRGVLKSMRESSSLPILSRASDARHFAKDPVFARMDELDRLSHDLWTTLARGTFEEDFKREVIQFKRNKLYR